MSADPQLDTFVRLFRGRADAYGSWHGGCVHEPLTPDHFEAHLYSDNPEYWIGVYNVIGDRCSWGCVDIDQPDWVLSHHIKDALSTHHIPAWVERTTRGYHVWCFPGEPLIPAWVMRRALIAACLAVNYHPKEVFPKQERTTGFGNYVRLPLNSSLARVPSEQSRRFISNATTAEMDRHRAPVTNLIQLAETLPEPDPQDVDIPVDLDAGLDVEEDVLAIGGHVLRLWRDGPRPGRDRSATMVHLAHRLYEKDVQPNLAFRIVASADERWGKYLTRGTSGVQLIRKIITDVYGRVS